MKIPIIKNTESAPFLGSTFGQDVEPTGTYVLMKTNDYLPPNWVSGYAEIKNPLIIHINDDTQITYKKDLANKYKAKGKSLTAKLMKLGYDAIITVEENNSYGEIILFPNANFYLNSLTENIIKILKEKLNKFV